MPASYPNSIVTLASHSDTTDTIFAADINTPNAEIVAVETGLLNGFQHDLLPLVDDAKSLGSTSKRWLKGWLQDLDLDGTFTLNGTAYTALSPSVNATCNGRLTLTSATPITTTDVTAATSLIWTPYLGKYVALYDGVSVWALLTFSELSIAVPATTSTMYDVFVYNNSGVAALELLAWTNDTTRATAITLQDGVWVKSGATTRRLIGCMRTTGVSGQTEDSLTKRYVANATNQVRRPLLRQESTSTWPYTTATFRQANAAAANQVEGIIALPGMVLDLRVASAPSNATGNVGVGIGIGEDSTSTPLDVGTGGVAAAQAGNSYIEYRVTRTPAIGRHFWAWLEISSASGTTTWVGSGGFTGATHVGGLAGWIEG